MMRAMQSWMSCGVSCSFTAAAPVEENANGKAKCGVLAMLSSLGESVVADGLGELLDREHHRRAVRVEGGGTTGDRPHRREGVAAGCGRRHPREGEARVDRCLEELLPWEPRVGVEDRAVHVV